MVAPEDWMGVYRTYDDVPDRYRLYHYAEAYDGRDVFAEFMDEVVLPRVDSKWSENDARRAERRWKEFVDGDVHHALATPDDFEAWGEALMDELALATATRYWTRIESFYRWLMWNAEFPHVYNPALMAAAQNGASAAIWTYQMGSS